MWYVLVKDINPQVRSLRVGFMKAHYLTAASPAGTINLGELWSMSALCNMVNHCPLLCVADKLCPHYIEKMLRCYILQMRVTTVDFNVSNAFRFKLGCDELQIRPFPR